MVCLADAREDGPSESLPSDGVGQARRLAHDVLLMHHGRVIEHQSAKDFFVEPKSDSARAFLSGGLVL